MRAPASSPEAVGTRGRPSQFQRLLSWKIGASLGSSVPEVKRSLTFSGMANCGHLPGFFFFLFIFRFVFICLRVVVVVNVVVIIIVFVDVVVILKHVLSFCRCRVAGRSSVAMQLIRVVETKSTSHKEYLFGGQDTGSVAGGAASGFAFGAAGGGYVVQKCRPQRLQTQN